MVLVDTSVFVDFFRGRSTPGFKELLMENQIMLSAYVRLELLQGVRKEELHKVEYVLGGLISIPHHEKLFEVVEKALQKIRGTGLTVGIVDLLLVGESILMNAPIYSFDKIFKKLSEKNISQLYDPRAS